MAAELTDETLARVEAELRRQLAQWRYLQYFPDDGPLARHLYPRHTQFFSAGAKHRERLFMAGNRVGKTLCGALETMFHCTGRYPHWWTGRMFDAAGNWTAAGTTLETTRDIVQSELFGPAGALGTGMIPASDIDDFKTRPNTNGAIDYAIIKRVTGGRTRLSLKSFDQGRTAFEGTSLQGVWLDEEPKQAIYTECLTRTATTGGIVMVTFTPLMGATDVVMDYINNGVESE